MTTLQLVSDDPQVIETVNQLTWCEIVLLRDIEQLAKVSEWSDVVLVDLAYSNAELLQGAIQRGLSQHWKMLVIAEAHQQNEVADYLQRGVDDYLLKPVHQALLEKRVRRFKDAFDIAEFMAFAANELKSSLMPVSGWADMIKHGLTSGISQEMIVGWLDIIRVCAFRTESTINDLCDIARLDASGRLDIDPRPVAFVPLVDEALVIFERRLQEHELSVRIDLPTDLPLVNGDDFRLVMLLRQILSNAIKYSGDEGEAGVITVLAQTRGDFLQVSIRDEGKGMKETDIEQYFVKGIGSSFSGMGTRLARAVVHDHGGEIWAENNPDKGITVHFTLPIAATGKS